MCPVLTHGLSPLLSGRIQPGTSSVRPVGDLCRWRSDEGYTPATRFAKPPTCSDRGSAESAHEPCLCRPAQGQRGTRDAAASRGGVAPPLRVREPRCRRDGAVRQLSPLICHQGGGIALQALQLKGESGGLTTPRGCSVGLAKVCCDMLVTQRPLEATRSIVIMSQGLYVRGLCL